MPEHNISQNSLKLDQNVAGFPPVANLFDQTAKWNVGGQIIPILDRIEKVVHFPLSGVRNQPRHSFFALHSTLHMCILSPYVTMIHFRSVPLCGNYFSICCELLSIMNNSITSLLSLLSRCFITTLYRSDGGHSSRRGIVSISGGCKQVSVQSKIRAEHHHPTVVLVSIVYRLILCWTL